MSNNWTPQYNENKSWTKEELAQLYDQQIEAILSNNFNEYLQLAGYTSTYRGEVDSHYEAWRSASSKELSLFGNLPNCKRCASQIEYHPKPPYFASEPVYQATRKKVLKNAPVHLPNFDSNDMPLSEPIPMSYATHYTFTRAELEEFKRRQLVARFGE